MHNGSSRRVTSSLRAANPTFFQTESPVLFEIIATTANEQLFYRFTIDGTVERSENPDNPDITSIGESNDTITENIDGTFTVEGETGNLFGDAWAVAGTVEDFTHVSGASDVLLRLDGTEVSPTDFPLETHPEEPPERPAIPVPESDTCDDHITAAQQHSTEVRDLGLDCAMVAVDMLCPFDDRFLYRAKDGCEFDALTSYGWEQPSLPPEHPDIPVPAAETCASHITAAQNYESSVVSAGFACSSFPIKLVCPFDQTTVYESPTQCQTDALTSYGWETFQEPPDDPDDPVESGFSLPVVAAIALGVGVIAYAARGSGSTDEKLFQYR